jgi:ribosomal protein S20
MRFVRIVAAIIEIRNTSKGVTENHEYKRRLKRHMRRFENNIRSDVKETQLENIRSDVKHSLRKTIGY